MIFKIALFSVLLQMSLGATKRGHCTSKAAFFRQATVNDASSATATLGSFRSVSEVECSQKCLHHEKCNYQIYRADTRKCEMMLSISHKDLGSNAAVLRKERRSVCQSKPSNICGEKCRCTDACNANEYICDCTGQDVYRTCKEALQANDNKAQNYWIQASEYRGAAQIKCMWSNTTRQYFAVFNHDTEAEVRVSGGYPDYAGAYQRSFSYTVDMVTIISIINQSNHCHQFTSAKCKGLYFVTRNCTWLKGRNGQRLKFWGGGPSNGIGCACGITNTCVNNAYKCNCDVNNNYNYYTDKGTVVDSRILPITGIAVGDIGTINVEVLYYRVGPLFCSI